MCKLHHLLFNKFVLALLVTILSSSAISQIFQLGDLAPRGAPDGQLNAADSLLLQRMVLGDIVPTNDEILLGDVAPLGNTDGVLNAGDLVVQQRAVLGQITLGTIETDTTPPAVINLETFSIDTSTVGQLTLTGLAGAVEAGATLNITNSTLGQSYTILVDSAGAFSISFAGLSGNTLLITVEDSAGNFSTTTQYIVGSIQILYPIDANIINDDTANIHGSFIGESNTGILVNGVVACVNGNEFYVNNVPLTNGLNDLSVVLTHSDGTKSSAIIQVTSTGSNNVDVSSAIDCGLDPLSTLFEVSTQNISVQQFSIDYDGDGSIDDTYGFVPISEWLSYVYTTPGIYEPEITIVDTVGTTTEKLYIVVQNEATQESILQDAWTGMMNALVANDKTTALTYISIESKVRYNAVFDALITNMPQIQNRISMPSKVSITADHAECAVLKNIGASNKIFFINYVRDADGVWRLDSM